MSPLASGMQSIYVYILAHVIYVHSLHTMTATASEMTVSRRAGQGGHDWRDWLIKRVAEKSYTSYWITRSGYRCAPSRSLNQYLAGKRGGGQGRCWLAGFHWSGRIGLGWTPLRETDRHPHIVTLAPPHPRTTCVCSPSPGSHRPSLCEQLPPLRPRPPPPPPHANPPRTC